jgi:hypothetical protein
MFQEKAIVKVTVYTCMGKGHHFTVPYYTKAYGDTGDKLLFVNEVNLSPKLTIEERQNSIVPNTDIPTLIQREPCCSIIVESTNCDQTLRLTFSGKLTVNVDNSINYDNIEHHVTISK